MNFEQVMKLSTELDIVKFQKIVGCFEKLNNYVNLRIKSLTRLS